MKSESSPKTKGRTIVQRLQPASTLRTFAIVTLLLGGSVTSGFAQETFALDEGPFTSISGFRGLSWGTAEADVIARFGEPEERRTLESGIEIIAYRGTLADRPSIVLLGFLADRGLVKAQEVSNLAGGEKCIEQVRDVHREVNLRYPLIRPAEEAKNNTPDAICSAAPAGDAYWHRQWRDETTGSVVTVSLRSGSDKVELTYESQAFIDWIGSEDGGATPEIEDEGAPAEVLEARP
ncbi:MAG: hypothetical protein ACODAA_01290 [Gemmatimonadota bacterium]